MDRQWVTPGPYFFSSLCSTPRRSKPSSPHPSHVHFRGCSSKPPKRPIQSTAKRSATTRPDNVNNNQWQCSSFLREIHSPFFGWFGRRCKNVMQYPELDTLCKYCTVSDDKERFSPFRMISPGGVQFTQH